MASIQEQEYVKICAQLASCLTISIAAAKKKIDIASARKGLKDLASRKKIAANLLEEAKENSLK